MASFRVFQQFRRAMSSDSVTVQVVQGRLRGKKMTSKYGGDYFTFRGVPYAKPPVGSLRFRAPQPAEGWSGVRDATVEGNVCPHRDLYTQKMTGDEDCLFLNIHTPKLPGEAGKPLKPVIVWIPGGTFTTGHGNADVYGPDFFIREDVILVTINYRLGLLGFLSMEDAGISGNAGLKDQVFALRWVKENIQSFGGDPNNVTLCGDSAGGSSVNYHLLSPMSKGLFERAVSLSGSVLNPYAFTTTSTSTTRAFILAELLGLKTDNPHELVDYLTKLPAMDIAKNLNKVLTKVGNKKGEVFPFLPTMEKNPPPGEEVFLPDTPINMLNAGQFQHVPYVTGLSNQDGLLMCRNLLNDPNLWSNLDQEFEKCIIMPLDLNLERHTDTSRELAKEIRKFYFGDGPLDESNVIDYSRMGTDIYFSLGIQRTLRRIVQHSTCPTYFYEFGFAGSLGLFKNFMNVKGVPGASHGDILGYIFTHQMLKHDLPQESTEMKTLNSIVKMLTNFAKHGTPTPESDKSLPVKWEPATVENNLSYLSIGDEISMKCEREKKRMDFWEEIYNRFGSKYDTKKSSD